MHLFKEYAEDYLSKGYSVIPDGFKKKLPLISKWNEYCIRKPSIDDALKWSEEYDCSNISVCLGEASGIIAVDFDCTDPDIVAAIEHLFPPSPAEKVGEKGWTRFFRYEGEVSRVVSFNGNVVFEILSTNKKTTLPPSIHPMGMTYEWKDGSLLDINKEELPEFPPHMCSSIELLLRTKFKEDIVYKNGKYSSVIAGRNDNLKTYVAQLINDNIPLDTAIQKMIEFDKENHDPPLLTDHREQKHLEKFTAAGRFYFSVLTSINNTRHIKEQAYKIPVIETSVNQTYMEEIEKGKSPTEENLKKLNPELPIVKGGVLGAIQDYILKNSFIKQPAFALSAALTVLSTLIGRKFEFEGVSSNLYILNVAPSGAGKDAPQQRVKDILIKINASHLLGAGDYVSDASLMDSLPNKPVRLDIVDEAGGLLRSVNNGGATFNNKMADILAELYTCSTSKFLGRATAEGVKGECIRPNVNLLCSTTPAGFSEGVSYKSIEKGLMGRFLVFLGEPDKRAERVKKFSSLDDETLDKLKYLAAFKPPNSNTDIANISQEFIRLESTEGASEELDIIFDKYDEIRINSKSSDPLLPIISRLYQQLLKIAMIHAVSRMKQNKIPSIDVYDVKFAQAVIEYYFVNIQNLLENDIFRSKSEENLIKMLKIIKSYGTLGVTRRDLYRKTRHIPRKERSEIVESLIETEHIIIDLVNGKQVIKVRK